MSSCTNSRKRRSPYVMVVSSPGDHEDNNSCTQQVMSGSHDRRDLPSHYFANLPEEIISDILSRVPWKYMCRLKCTCTYWYNSINSFSLSPMFLALSNTEEPELFGGMFYQNHTEVVFTALTRFGSRIDEEELIDRGLPAVEENVTFFPSDFCVEGCRLGLLLCSRRKLYEMQFGLGNIDRYYICNPVTKKFAWLPKSLMPYSKHAGFLVDDKSGHYQVIQIPLSYPQTVNEHTVAVDLYSSASCTWRTERLEFIRSPDENTNLICNSGYQFVINGPTVQIRGSLYWVGVRNLIVWCDVERKKIRLVKQPKFEGFEGKISTPCLGEFNGVLRCALSDCKRVFVWDYYHQEGYWELSHSVSLGMITQRLHWRLRFGLGNVKCLAIHGSDAERVFLDLQEMVVAYNFTTQKVEIHKRFDENVIELTPETGSAYLLPKVPLPPETLFPYVLPKMPLPVF